MVGRPSRVVLAGGISLRRLRGDLETRPAAPLEVAWLEVAWLEVAWLEVAWLEATELQQLMNLS